MYDEMTCDDSFNMTLSHQKQILINKLELYGCHTIVHRIKKINSSVETIRVIAKSLSAWATRRHDQDTLDELRWAELL